MEPPSLVARIAPSFIRIGHFEALNPGKAARNLRQIYFGGNWLDEGKDAEAAKGPLGGEGNLEGLRDLTEWCIGIMGTTGGSEGWVREVIKRNAEMVAGWQVGTPFADRAIFAYDIMLTSGVRMDARCAE